MLPKNILTIPRCFYVAVDRAGGPLRKVQSPRRGHRAKADPLGQGHSRSPISWRGGDTKESLIPQWGHSREPGPWGSGSGIIRPCIHARVPIHVRVPVPVPVQCPFPCPCSCHARILKFSQDSWKKIQVVQKTSSQAIPTANFTTFRP
jgi:hypothetical protein